MEESLDRFSVFIMENANKQDAFEFCKQLGVNEKDIEVYEELSIDATRKIKEKSFIASNTKRGFVLGKMGNPAQNSLLKLLEEPPNNVCFVLYRSEELLDTIKSRAQIIKKNTERKVDEDFLDAINNNDMQKAIICALKLHRLQKDNLIELLEGVARELSLNGGYSKSEIIEQELIKFREFRLNQRLFMFALVSKIFGGF